MKKYDSKMLWAAGFFILALTLRIIYFLQIKSHFPGWDTPTIDPLYHDLWARQIASGDILGAGPFFRAPFYAYFLAAIYALFGHSLAAAKIIQHIIGAGACSLIFLFADRYFGRRTAIVAGLLAAFNWVLIFHEDELLLDFLLVLFSLLLIWSLIRAVEKQSAKRFLLPGLILGLACITRPNYLTFLPAIIIWLAAVFRGQYGAILKNSLILAAACFLMILPVTLRNIIVGHDTVLIASQGGINFYIGNNGRADGASAVMPEFGPTWQYSDAEFLAQQEMGKIGQPLKPSEVSDFYYDRSLDFIRKMPGAWIALTFKKFILFWNSYEISNNQNLYFFRQFAGITNILPPLFGLIAPLSILGLIFVFGMEKKYHIIGYFIILYMLTVIGFFVNSRFRLPVLPLLIVLASWAFWKMVDVVQEGSWKRIVSTAAAVVLLFFLTNYDFYGFSRESFAMSHFSLGNVYLKKGLATEALKEYQTAIGMADCVPKAHLNRGVIFFGQKDYIRARQEFEMELFQCHQSAEALNNLSVLDRLEGKPEAALSEARQAIAIMPQHREAYVNEIIALRILKNDAEALRTADRLTAMFPDYAPGHYLKGMILKDKGQIEAASAEFHQILDLKAQDIAERYDLSTIYAAQAGYGYSPEKITGLAQYELGLISVKKGNIDSALALFKSATQTMPEYADAWTNLALAYDHKQLYPDALAAFRKSIELDPSNPLVYYNCGLTVAKLGRLADAAQFFQQALDLKPDFTEAAEKLKLTQRLLNSTTP